MSEKMIENNKVSVIGEIVSGFTFSHEVFGEGFYMVELSVNRLSQQADRIPLMISERLIDVEGRLSGLYGGSHRTVSLLQPPRRGKKPSDALGICAGNSFYGGLHGLYERPTRFSLTATSAKPPFTARRLLDGRSRICFWR